MQERGKQSEVTCTGGRSFGCKREEHPIGRIANVLCYRCKTRLGCSVCCERASEIICLECHNWATHKAVRIHGDVVPNIKVPRVRTDQGWITHHPLTAEVNAVVARGWENAK